MKLTGRFQKKLSDPVFQEHATVWGVLLFLFMVRALFLEADAPEGYMNSYGVYFTDEGYRSYPARDKALFGLPFSTIAQWNSTPAPVTLFLCQYAIFKVAGVGYWQARLVSVLFSFGCLLLFFCITRNFFNFFTSLLLLLMLGLNSAFFFDSRLALAETPMIFFLLLALYLLIKAKNGKNYLHGIAGLVCCCAYLTKPHAVPFIAAYVLALFIMHGGQWRVALQNALIFVISLIVCYTAAIGVFSLTGSKQIFIGAALTESGQRFMAVPGLIVENLSSFPSWYVYDKEPVLMYCTIFFVFVFLYRFLRNTRDLSWLEYFVFMWIIFQSFGIAVFHYQPIRYFLPLLPPVCLACAVLLWQVPGFSYKQNLGKLLLYLALSGVSIFLLLRFCFALQRDVFDLSWKQNLFAANGIAAGALSLFLLTITVILFRKVKTPLQLLKERSLFLLALFLFVISFLAVRDGPSALMEIGVIGDKTVIFYYLIQSLVLPLLCFPFIAVVYGGAAPPSHKNVLVFCLCIAAVLWNVYPYAKWLGEKGHSLISVSRDIGKIAGEKAVLFSRAATSLCLGNRLFAVNNIADIPRLLPYFYTNKIPVYVAVTNEAEYHQFGEIMEKKLIPMGVGRAVLLYDTIVFRNYYECSCLLHKIEFERDCFLREPLQGDSNAVEAHCEAGNVLIKEGKIGEAKHHFEKALRIRPDLGRARNNYAAILIDEGDLAEAKKQLELAIFAIPIYAEAYYNLALVLDRLNEKTKSVEMYKKAVFLRAHLNANLSAEDIMQSLREYENSGGMAKKNE